MIVSNAWLKEFFPHNIGEAEIAEKLTLAGFEVVGMQRVNQIAKGLVVGEVLTKKKHPEADKLNLVEIAFLQDAKKVVEEIICGADNIAAGQKIVFAPIGTDLGEGFIIRKAKIRGIYSCGMVCSKEEVGQEEKSDGIWVLPEETALESSLRDYFGEEDTLFDIDLTSNRPDCYSVVGIARELQAIVAAGFFDEDVKTNHALLIERNFAEKEQDSPATQMQAYEPKKVFSSLTEGGSNSFPVEKIPFEVQVDASDEDVPVYLVRVISGVEVGPSPLWLARKLSQHGLRPLNVVVDVTNLMMLEYGQPMHAFNCDTITQRKIIVRNAKNGEKLEHLMNDTAECTPQDVVIADDKKPIAFAGVIGGRHSAVTLDSNEIVLEAGVFGKHSVAATAKHHGLPTDASTYFQRYVAADRTAFVLDRAAQLIIDLAVKKNGHVIVGEIIGKFPPPILLEKKRTSIFTPSAIAVTHAHIQRVLGEVISEQRVIDLLLVLGFSVEQADGEYSVVPPFFRQDVNYAWDVVEEVVRMYGYNNVPMEVAPIRHSDYSIAQYSERKALNLASALGFQEVMTYPFIETDLIEEIFTSTTNLIQVQNPMQKNYAFLRNSLLYGMLRTLRLNVERGRGSTFQLAECGHVFFPSADPREKKKYQEKPAIGFLFAAPTTKEGFSESGFSVAKGAVEAFIAGWNVAISLDSVVTKPTNFPYSYHFSCANLMSGEETLASVARVNDEFIDFFHIKRMVVFYAEVDLQALDAFPKKDVKYQPISNYPSVYRDIALVVKKTVPLGALQNHIAVSLPLVRSVKLAEVYTGKGIEEDEKSFVFNVELRAKDKTLQSEQADELVLKIIEVLREKHTFRLR